MAGVFAYLRITGENIDVEDVEEKLNMHSDWVCKKGDILEGKYPQIAAKHKETCKDFDTKAKKDCWQIGKEAKAAETVDMFINRFLDLLLPRITQLHELSNKYTVEIFINRYMENRQESFCVSVKMLQKLALLGVPIYYGITYLGE